MDAVKIGALALVCLVAIFILRQWKPEWAPLVRITAALVFGTLVVTMASSVLSFTDNLATALPDGVWPILVKALGIAFLTEIAAGVCRDSGENTLASWVETAGKLEMILLSLPLIETVLDAAGDLLGR